MRWRGGDLDRLLDARHARLAETATRLLQAAGWEVAPEVSFSVYGERGSIVLLAWHPGTRTLLVIELESELTSIEETLRRHDTKVRLAGRIGRERFGWRAAGVARRASDRRRTGGRARVRHARTTGARRPGTA
ncbi:MAG TPA: hypothetical protein VFO78_02955 [Candidatus Limnocylindrales bacterium]|nr:hypothetical protein [Candidatus Limnocylindrales bacterium]